jgi:hypothetical protein
MPIQQFMLMATGFQETIAKNRDILVHNTTSPDEKIQIYVADSVNKLV